MPLRELITDQVLHATRVEARRASARTNGNVDADELFSVGQTALAQCAQRHDPSRGLFSYYALTRVRGAMQDYLRALDPTPRRVRQEARRIQAKDPRLITPAERRTLGQVCSVFSVDSEPAGFLDRAHPFNGVPDIHKRDPELLLPVLITLDPVYQFVVWQTVVHEHTLTEVGGFLDLTAQRAQQIKKRALELLRLRFNESERNHAL